ncbi:uncharacterized protein Z520_07816 [Fonsecaea multimorphosa CBS 102226]|uniref:Glutathione S-transferase n=1 Tax=Fonsecaea multimorphosa CBS 102226 TaxID=1442371 RepID=A0A0D2H3Y2_9EURO|nr:uncharacterized protein Z520_07816 [Fonsecaea multimorphosa CBS 102226]KIX96550.1 hypothetical protein Z520_07816 [Fonsecaea multimorphosa CBS 102226]OAL22163.1 hypothetical protein AYO22_07424 [Fonsecaea multimorphosa]
MSSLEPIKVHAHASGPNPWKVAIVLEELGVPYYMHMYSDMADLKKEPYTLINPNGRVPAIEDPNTGVTLWESGAIIQYLLDKYDPAGKLSYKTEPEKFYVNQWLFFQASGQGPYFGQLAWFTRFHHEDLPSAKERYHKEAGRVIMVLDSWLQKHKYLVGDKVTGADLSFLPWAAGIDFLAGDKKIEKGEAYQAWFNELMARPAVKKVFADKAKAMATQKH